jgi:hypothetical protein
LSLILFRKKYLRDRHRNFKPRQQQSGSWSGEGGHEQQEQQQQQQQQHPTQSLNE